jgi:hypothetical protein
LIEPGNKGGASIYTSPLSTILDDGPTPVDAVVQNKDADVFDVDVEAPNADRYQWAVSAHGLT